MKPARARYGWPTFIKCGCGDVYYHTFSTARRDFFRCFTCDKKYSKGKRKAKQGKKEPTK